MFRQRSFRTILSSPLQHSSRCFCSGDQWWTDAQGECSGGVGLCPAARCSVCPLSLAAVWRATWGSAASSATWSGGSSSAPGGPRCGTSPSPCARPRWPCCCCWASWLPTATGTASKLGWWCVLHGLRCCCFHTVLVAGNVSCSSADGNSHSSAFQYLDLWIMLKVLACPLPAELTLVLVSRHAWREEE